MPGLDVVVVGGGFAGASLALALASGGVEVLVLEREREFRDRVRGELLYPWGVAAGRSLGSLQHVAPAAIELRSWRSRIQPLPASERDLPTSTPSGEPALAFSHPEVQERLLAAAQDAGAEVVRGARVKGVEPGDRPVVVSTEGASRSERRREAALVVGADGRESLVRREGPFAERQGQEALVIAGALLEGAAVPDDAGHVFMRPAEGTMAFTVPIGGGRHRVYAGYHVDGGRRHLSGSAALPGFLETVVGSGAPEGWFEGARLVGPLAEFSGNDTWVERAYAGGIALVGDAAATSDPNWGCGLALAWRGVRALAAALLDSGDPQVAGADYAEEQRRDFAALRRQTDWLTAVFRTPGPEADALRERVVPLLVADPTRAPDVVGVGPDGPSDEAARRRFLGEEA